MPATVASSSPLECRLEVPRRLCERRGTSCLTPRIVSGHSPGHPSPSQRGGSGDRYRGSEFRCRRAASYFPLRLAKPMHEERRDDPDQEYPSQDEEGVLRPVGVAELRRLDETHT